MQCINRCIYRFVNKTFRTQFDAANKCIVYHALPDRFQWGDFKSLFCNLSDSSTQPSVCTVLLLHSLLHIVVRVNDHQDLKSYWTCTFEKNGNLYKVYMGNQIRFIYRFNLIQYFVFKLSNAHKHKFTNSIDTVKHSKLFWQFAAALKIGPLFITAIAHLFYTQHRYPVLDLNLFTPCFGRVSFKIVAGIKIYAHLSGGIHDAAAICM